MWRQQWEWNRFAANAVIIKIIWAVIKSILRSPCPFKKSLFCSTGKGCNRANRRASGVTLVFRKGLVLAGNWRQSEAQDPGHSPVPCWALPGHGVNTEQAFGTLPPYKDYLLKEWNKTGRHAKLRSMHQLSPVWKGYCWKLKSVILCSSSLRSCLGDGKRLRQMEAQGLEAGYADRGRRFVRVLHPAVDIIAALTQKQLFLSTALHWSG